MSQSVNLVLVLKQQPHLLSPHHPSSVLVNPPQSSSALVTPPQSSSTHLVDDADGVPDVDLLISLPQFTLPVH